ERPAVLRQVVTVELDDVPPRLQSTQRGVLPRRPENVAGLALAVSPAQVPLGLRLPPPMVPASPSPSERNARSRSAHCATSCRRWTRTSVLRPRRAISAAATTVLPNAVVAASTPQSWAASASAAAA